MDDEESIILGESGSPHDYPKGGKKKQTAKVISSFRYLVASELQVELPL
jgi:hypothetical protein